MSRIGNSIIWEESTHELVERWARRYPDQMAATKLSTRVIAQQLEDASTAVMAATGLRAAPQVNTVRKWEVQWKPVPMERMIRDGFKAIGWGVQVLEANQFNPQSLARGSMDSSDCALFLRPTAQERVTLLSDVGLDLPFSTQDGILLLMAEELFLLGAEQLGLKLEPPVVEMAGPYVFAQHVLGLPFSPWAQFLV